MPPHARSYSISEVSALTGLHRNTVRIRIKTGQLRAEVSEGKFGDEYRITHSELVAQGLVIGEAPTDTELGAALDAESDPVLDAEYLPDEASVNPPSAGSDSAAIAALTDLYERHEQAMFRLGYMQGELDRVKALAESAESLQSEREAQAQLLRETQAALETKTLEAAATEQVRRELEAARAQLREVETLRQEIEALKTLAIPRPWWRFWGA